MKDLSFILEEYLAESKNNENEEQMKILEEPIKWAFTNEPNLLLSVDELLVKSKDSENNEEDEAYYNLEKENERVKELLSQIKLCPLSQSLNNVFKIHRTKEFEDKFEQVEVSEIIQCSAMSNNLENCTIIIGVRKEGEERIIDINEALRENMIDIENQTYNTYSDQNNNEISWREAIKEDLMIAHEVNKNMITPEYLRDLIDEKFDKYSFENDIEIVRVVDTSTDQTMDKSEAEVLQLLDLNSHLFNDTLENKWIPIEEAIKHGHILAKLKDIECELERVNVESIKIGENQRQVNLEEAINENCIDNLTNKYTIEEDNLEMSLLDAILFGIINVSEKPETGEKHNSNWLVLQRQPDDPEIEDLYNYQVNHDVNIKLLSKANECDCLNEFLIFDNIKEGMGKSIYLNHLELDPLICGKDEKRSILIGCIKDEVNLEKLEKLLVSMKDMFVGEIIDGLNMKSTGREIMDKLNEENYIDKANEMLVIDDATFTISSVSKCDKEDKDKIYTTKIDPPNLKAKLNQLKYLESFGIDTLEKVLKANEIDDSKQYDMSIFEATLNNKFIIDELEILDTKAGEMCSMIESVEKGIIDIKVAESLLECMESLSFEDLKTYNVYNMEENSFGESISLEKAIEDKIVEPELVYLSLPKENKLINLKLLIEDGILNPSTNEVQMENSNKEVIVMKLNEAINSEFEFLSPLIDSVSLKKYLPTKLKYLLCNCTIDAEVDFVDFGISIIPSSLLTNAMSSGLISNDTIVRLLLKSAENAFQEVLFCDNHDLLNSIFKLNEFWTKVKNSQLELKNLKMDDDKRVKTRKNILENLLSEEKLVYGIIDPFLKIDNLEHNTMINENQLKHIRSTKSNIRSALNEISDNIQSLNSASTSIQDLEMVNSLTNSINKSKLKLNTMNRQIKNLKKYSYKNESNQFSQSQILDSHNTLKSFQSDLSDVLSAISVIKDEFSKIQNSNHEQSLSKKLVEIDQDIESLENLYQNVNSEFISIMSTIEELLNAFSEIEKSLDNLKSDFNELETKYNAETKYISLDTEKLDMELGEMVKYYSNANNLEQAFNKLDNYINDHYREMEIFLPLSKEIKDYSIRISDFKKLCDIRQNLLSETKIRLLELIELSDCFNESVEKINNNLNGIKTLDKTDETLQDIISLRKDFMDSISNVEQLKYSCDSYINNAIFKDKDRIIDMFNNNGAEQKELYSRVNEELVRQVESKISLLLIELGKLQIFVMDMPKNLDTNISDIKERINEIQDYIDNLQIMERDLKNIDIVLSEDLCDQLEIDFELLEKAIMNIQYCEKERLSTYTDLEKILNIISKSYLPTIIIYENNKQIAENLIIETNQNLEEHIQDCNNQIIYEKDKDTPYFMDLIKSRKANLHKLENVLFEIEPIVEAVESYGFDLIEQLIELTSDYGSDCSFLQLVKDDIQDIRQKFKTLKSKISELESKMVDLLSPNSKSISERLSNEYESWRSLNDVISRLDPIQSFPDKLKKQFEEITFLWDQIKKKESLFQPFKQTINKIISDNNNMSEIQDDIKDTFDDIQIDNDNLQSNEIQELNDYLKEIESLVDSVFYKVEHRMTIIGELKEVANKFWSEISELNEAISNIEKQANAIEAFPNTKEEKSYKNNRFSSIQSDSISILTELDNKSTISSVDFEFDDKLNEDYEIEFSSINITKELEPDLVNPELVKQQNTSLKKMETSLQDCKDKLQTEMEPKGSQIIKIGGPSCELEINEHMDLTLEEISVTEDVIEEKQIIMDKALYFVQFLSEEIKNIFKWFSTIENRMNNMDDAIPDQKMIELSIMELKALNAEIFSKSIKLDKIGSAITEILSYPYVPNKLLLEDLKSNINEKYADLIRKIIGKHNELQLKYDDIGEIDFLLEDNIGILQEFENQMKNLTPQSCKGDVEYTYSCLKNLRLLCNAFNGLLPVFKSLDEKVRSYGNLETSNLRYRGTLSIFGKLQEIKDLTNIVINLISEKDSMIQEILKNEKLISKELHTHIEYVDKLKSYLKQSPKVGLDEESVNQSNQSYVNCISDFNKQKIAIESSLRLGNGLIENCPHDKCTFLSTTIKTLSHKYKRCQYLADKRREKMDYYSQIILEFDKEKQTLLKDILELELMTLNKMTPSKITATCAEQIKAIKISIQKADKCFNIFENLNIRSFEIKCFGTRIDNSKLNLELREYSLKLNKVQKCLRERIRIFHQAYREDKLFSDSYESLNNWLDESYNLVESFRKEPSKVLDHLDKLKNLCNQLSAQYANFHCTIRYGTNLKDRCVGDDPEKAILIEMLKVLKVKWNKIRNLIVTEKTTINRKMIETGNIYDALKCVSYWINESITKFVPDMKVCGDIDTVEVLIDECKLAEDEAVNHGKDFENLKKRMLREIKDYDECDIRNTMKHIEDQFSLYVLNVKQRSKVLEEALQLAKEFNNRLDQLQNWLRKTEKQLKVKALPKFQNESELIELIETHESFLKVQKEMKSILNEFNNLGKIILTNCHPMAKNYLNRIMFSIGTRWNQINQRGEDRSKKLNESLGILRGSTALIEDLIYKINDSLYKIQIANAVEPPTDIPEVNDLINKHLTFNNGLNEIDVQIKKLIKDFKLQHSTNFANNQTKKYRSRVEFYKNLWRNSRDSLNRSCDDLTGNNRLNFLNSQFNKLWKMSVERKASLQSHLMNLNEKEQLKKFDFNTWKSDFNNYIKVKGLRLTDLFRRQISSSVGYHTLNEFISCITKSGFPTNKYVLQEVFNIFNKNNGNEISYQEFIDSMRPERKSHVDKSINLNDKKAVTMIIHDIIEQEVAECTCKIRFFVKKEEENKYRFGLNNKKYMVRYLNSTVMVRIGGGWQTITEFLKKNDPCRAIDKSISRLSSVDSQKYKSLKSQNSSENKTGYIYAKPKHGTGDKSPALSSRQEHRPSLSSKIPTNIATKTTKKP